MRWTCLAFLLLASSAFAAVDCTDRRWFLPQSDPGYLPAAELVKYLESRHVAVRCITSTKIGNLLLGRPSAGINTDHGSLSVVFFPRPDGAEHVTSELTVRHDHYRYRFTSHEGFWPRHDTIDTDGPLHFLIHGPWLVFVWDTETERAVRVALTRHPLAR